jgi:6-phosphogluconolactonase
MCHDVTTAHNIIFLVECEDKAQALKEVIDGERNSDRYPSQLIKPYHGALLWMVDQGAAKLLPG